MIDRDASPILARVLPTALIWGAALLASAAIYFTTRWGPWAFSDGVGYITNARNLLLGNGLGIYRASGQFILLVTHPPLYSLTLALLGVLGMGLLSAARWIDVACFGALILVSGLLLAKATGSRWLGAGLAAILLVNPAIILAYASAMSEPILLFTGMASLVSMAVYLEIRSRRYLLVSALMAALAFLTRYPGAAYALAGLVALGVFGAPRRTHRIKEIGLYGAISLLPTFLFIAWSRFVLASRNPRGLKSTVELMQLARSFVHQAWPAIWSWKPIPPEVIPHLPVSSTQLKSFAILATALIGVAIAFSAVRSLKSLPAHIRGSHWRVPTIFLIFETAYVLFFLAAFFLTSPTPDVNSRTLLPMLPAGLALLLTAGYVLTELDLRRLLPTIAISAAVVLAVVGYGAISQDIVFGLHRTGLGYTSAAWRSSETMRVVEQLPKDLRVVTNEPAAVLLYTNRAAYEIPGLDPPDPSAIPLPFGSGSTDQETLFNHGKAVLVLFNSIDHQLGNLLPQSPAPTSRLTNGLTAGFIGDDGSIYCQACPSLLGNR